MNGPERIPPETEKGFVFESYKDFYAVYDLPAPEKEPHPAIRIYGKKVENGQLVDDPLGFVDARPHRINNLRANMNVFEGNKLIAYFRLDDKNISFFRIEIRNR